MSMPLGPDWYDDPDDPKAQRWWDGQSWSPNRRRKQVAPPMQTPPPPPPPQFYPGTPMNQPASVEPYPYPDSYPAFAHGFPPTDVQQPSVESPLAQNLSVSARPSIGLAEVIGMLMALSGLASIGSAFATWGKARAAGFLDGTNASWSVSYPGLGSPSERGTLSDSDGSIEVIPDGVLDNTNPGLIAVLLGAFVIVIGAALYIAWNRKVSAVVAAVSGVTSLVFCISYLIDVRGAFGDPAGLVNIDDFSPGFGLLATTALSLIIVALGVAAFVVEQRTPHRPY